MVIQKADALEFVQSLDGGWDCIIFDPPYIDSTTAGHKDFKEAYKRHGEIWTNPERFHLDWDYIWQLKDLILSKTDSYIFFHVDKIIYNFWDYWFVWYKGKGYQPAFPTYIGNNCSFIGINIVNKKPFRGNKLMKVESYKSPTMGSNQFSQKTRAMSLPFLLIKKMLEFAQAEYVLDPFAGSYVTAKVCNRLGIKYDTCDKYLDPPTFQKTNLKEYGIK
jgi:DNA modification methylase